MSNAPRRSQISSGVSRQSSIHHRSATSNSQSGRQYSSAAHRSYLSSNRPPQAALSNSTSRHIAGSSGDIPVQSISSQRNQQTLRSSTTTPNGHSTDSWSAGSTSRTANRALARSTSSGRISNSSGGAPVRSSSTTRAIHSGRHQEFQLRNSISREKEHWSHLGCILRWVDHYKPMYSCNGCRMDGMGMRYRCDKHDFDLHQECMSAYPWMRITFQGDNCTFFNEPHRNRTYCDACGFKVEGFVFHSDRGRDFHPKCAKLETKIDIENIKYMLSPTLLSNCQWCKRTRAPGADKEIPGWAYVSSSGCGFHVNCVFRMAMQVRRTGGDLALTFQPNTGGRSRIGINRKLLEKLGIIGFKILVSTLLGPLGGVVHVVDLLPSH